VKNRLSNHPRIEVRSFKWPRRPTSVTVAQFLGEDRFGRWLDVAGGDPWWFADRSRTGVFEAPLVKVVPSGAYWTACFHPTDPVVDVDIVLPVSWANDVLEEVDLELDVLRLADGSVHVRNQESFDHVRMAWRMPSSIAKEAQATCERVRALVKQNSEPFGTVGQKRLADFIAETGGRF
jgi:hypothetical protein